MTDTVHAPLLFLQSAKTSHFQHYENNQQQKSVDEITPSRPFFFIPPHQVTYRLHFNPSRRSVAKLILQAAARKLSLRFLSHGARVCGWVFVSSWLQGSSLAHIMGHNESLCRKHLDCSRWIVWAVLLTLNIALITQVKMNCDNTSCWLTVWAESCCFCVQTLGLWSRRSPLCRVFCHSCCFKQCFNCDFCFSFCDTLTVKSTRNLEVFFQLVISVCILQRLKEQLLHRNKSSATCVHYTCL